MFMIGDYDLTKDFGLIKENICIHCARQFSDKVIKSESHIIPLCVTGRKNEWIMANSAECAECNQKLGKMFESKLFNIDMMKYIRAMNGLLNSRNKYVPYHKYLKNIEFYIGYDYDKMKYIQEARMSLNMLKNFYKVHGETYLDITFHLKQHEIDIIKKLLMLVELRNCLDKKIVNMKRISVLHEYIWNNKKDDTIFIIAENNETKASMAYSENYQDVFKLIFKSITLGVVCRNMNLFVKSMEKSIKLNKFLIQDNCHIFIPDIGVVTYKEGVVYRNKDIPAISFHIPMQLKLGNTIRKKGKKNDQ